MTDQVYGFKADVCQDLMHVRRSFNAGQLTNYPSLPAKPQTGISGLESYVLLQELGPRNTFAELGGTTIEADALRLEPTTFPVWYVWVPLTNEQEWTFKLTYNGVESGLLLESPNDIQAFLVSQGATGCVVWGQNSSITADDGTVYAGAAGNAFFIAFKDGYEPETLTGRAWLPAGGPSTGVASTGVVPSIEPFVVTRLVDLFPVDGVVTIGLSKPIRWTQSFRAGEIVDALPQPARGANAIADARNLGLGPQPYILVNTDGSFPDTGNNIPYTAGTASYGYAKPAIFTGNGWEPSTSSVDGTIVVSFAVFTGVAFTGQLIWVETDIPTAQDMHDGRILSTPYNPMHYAVSGGNTFLTNCRYVSISNSVVIHYNDVMGNARTVGSFAFNWTRICLQQDQYVAVAVDSKPGFTPFNIVGVGGPCCPSPCDASSLWNPPSSSSSGPSSSSTVSSSSISSSSSDTLSSSSSSMPSSSSSGPPASSSSGASSSSSPVCGICQWSWVIDSGGNSYWGNTQNSCTNQCQCQQPAFQGSSAGEPATTNCANATTTSFEVRF